MSCQLVKTLDNENWIKSSGKLTALEFQKLQALAGLSVERFGPVRLLVKLEDFQGLKREPGWVDSFFRRGWKPDVFILTGMPMRKTVNEFFP